MKNFIFNNKLLFIFIAFLIVFVSSSVYASNYDLTETKAFLSTVRFVIISDINDNVYLLRNSYNNWIYFVFSENHIYCTAEGSLARSADVVAYQLNDDGSITSLGNKPCNSITVKEIICSNIDITTNNLAEVVFTSNYNNDNIPNFKYPVDNIQTIPNIESASDIPIGMSKVIKIVVPVGLLFISIILIIYFIKRFFYKVI